MADRLAVAREPRRPVGQVALVLLLADREAEVRPRARAVDALAALRREERDDVVARGERRRRPRRRARRRPRPRGRAPSARSRTGRRPRRCRGRCGRRRTRRAARAPRRRLGSARCQLLHLERGAEPLEHRRADLARARALDYDSSQALRICLVTPFAWSQPHDVNEHVAGIAQELRALGHAVTVLAPSGRTADLVAGRRALARGEDADVIAIGAGRADLAPARASACRSACARTCASRSQQGRFDVVHGFEPGLPSLSYLALRDAEALGVATFFSPERLGYPPRRRSASSCSAGSMRCSRPRRRPRRPRPSASPATTGSSPPASTPSSSSPARSGSWS